MNIEAMERYPNYFIISSSSSDPTIIGLQHQIVDLTEIL